MPSYFTSEHAAILREVEDFLQSFLDARLAQAPAREHPDLSRLYDSIYSYLHNGGRRMHAVSIVLAYEACGGAPRAAILPVAAGFQLYHYHTLVHDDIYDDDNRRRGIPTIHRRFADLFGDRRSQASIVSVHGVFRNDVERRGAIAGWVQGKIVHALAFEALFSAPFEADKLLPVIQHLNWHDLADNAGQFQDVIHEGKQIPTPIDCIGIAEMKTGRLFVAGVQAGAQLAGASGSQQKAISAWINQLAIAYQLQDDLADLSKHSEKGQGRAIGTDLATCKPTYLLALARTHGDATQRAALDAWIEEPSRDPESLERMVRLLAATGAVERCAQEIRHRVQLGLEALDEALPPLAGQSREWMAHFSEYFVSTEYWERPLTPPSDPLMLLGRDTDGGYK